MDKKNTVNKNNTKETSVKKAFYEILLDELKLTLMGFVVEYNKYSGETNQISVTPTFNKVKKDGIVQKASLAIELKQHGLGTLLCFEEVSFKTNKDATEEDQWKLFLVRTTLQKLIAAGLNLTMAHYERQQESPEKHTYNKTNLVDAQGKILQ